MQTLERTHPKFVELKARLAEIEDLNAAASLLYWDQATYMPPGGASARGRQLATIHQIAHEKLIDGTVAQLLQDLTHYAAKLPYDSDEASLIRIAHRIYDQAANVPASFMARLSQLRTDCYQAWAQARPANNFKLVRPHLEEMLDLSREWASFFPGYQHIADPLIALSDYGMGAAQIRQVFSELRQELVPVVQAILAQPALDDSCLRQRYLETDQEAFTLKVLESVGYDFNRGRQDLTLHPFMINFSIDDVRITTRIYEHDLSQSLFCTIHEMGHALYEQGNNPQFEGTPLAGGISSGVHESQSRLWENLVGRSRPFWEHFYPQLQATFPQQLGACSLDTFYRAINKVARSLIRTDADEVTYNLHVMIRFDLELDLLEGKLSVKDLPEAWNERYRSDLGLVPKNDNEGILQDVHWYTGHIGGVFQGYTLGNLIASQVFESALEAHPNLYRQFAEGEFGTLHEWLRQNIYHHGRKYTPAEIVERVSGQPLTTEPLMRYIRSKFGDLYNLQF
jgi:carboxypeptidase Taq